MTKKLHRSKKDRMLAGICGGIAESLDADPTIIRLLWVLFSLFGGGVLIYLILWFIMPEKGSKK